LPWRDRIGRTLEALLIGLGLLGLGFWSFETVGTRRHAAAQEAKLRDGGGDENPALLGRLEIPRLDLRVVVEEGVDDATLRRAAGHLPGSARPGQPGNVVVAAHRDTLFRPLRDVRAGDLLRFSTRTASYDYEVTTTQVVEPWQTQVLAARDGYEMTLVTCYPFGYIGPAPQRFVVRARALGRASLLRSSPAPPLRD